MTQAPAASMTPFHLPVLRQEGFRRMAGVRWTPDTPPAPQAAAPDADTPPTPVICVHGLTRNGRDFDILAPALAAASGGEVWCPDVLGRGRSDCLTDPSGYTNLHYAEDMAALIAAALARSGTERVDWIGTSMGGLIGLILASLPNSPIRRLVLNDVGVTVTKAAMERIAAYVGSRTNFANVNHLEAHLRTIHAPFGPLPASWWHHMAEHGAWHKEDGSVSLAYDPAIAAPFSAQVLGDVHLWDLWEAITCPVLVIRGALSDLLLPETVEEMTQRGPGCRVVEIPGVGHAPTLTEAPQTDPLIAFLTEAA